MRRALLGMVILVASTAVATAAPHIPASDDETVERLPFSPGDPTLRKVRGLNEQLKGDPQNLPLALTVARTYLELGRKRGDPRYVGYAQAALAPWWDLDAPPAAVSLLRAAARQRSHLFEAALLDLSNVVASDPRNAQARLMRATILQVMGAFDAARVECEALPERSLGLILATCIANVESATGKLRESIDAMKSALEQSPRAPQAIRGWATTLLAEMTARAGDAAEAEARFHDALGVDPDDAYLLAAYADFLLDAGKAAEVEKLLRDKERMDPLLLRLALAARALGSDTLTERVAQLRERFDAARRRGESVHLREEARFHLALLDDPRTALNLARANWRVQKEPADLRVLVEAALAAGDLATLDLARKWQEEAGLEDSHIQNLLATAHPK